MLVKAKSKMPMAIPHTKMFVKAKLMMPKLVMKPLAKMLAKAVLLIAKVSGEALC